MSQFQKQSQVKEVKEIQNFEPEGDRKRILGSFPNYLITQVTKSNTFVIRIEAKLSGLKLLLSFVSLVLIL